MAESRVKVASVDDVPAGEGRVFEVHGRTVAIFNVDGRFYALDNECPHRGGPLGEGDLEGCIVTCPWHAWQYDVRTGESITDDLKVARYDVKVEGGDVLVAVD